MLTALPSLFMSPKPLNPSSSLHSLPTRQEDPWNSITAGAATGGVLAARAGYKVMAKNAAIGGVLLALIEGLGVLINQMVAPPAPSMGMEVEGAVGGSAAPPKITQSVAPPTATITMGSSDNSSSGGGGDYYSDSGSKSDGMEGFDTGAGVAGGRSDTYSNQAEMKRCEWVLAFAVY